MNSKVRKIGIIGAGVSGLIAAKTFLEEGFDCEVFERKGSLGGVWENGYHTLHLQLPKDSYEFLDWPMPASYPTYPSCDQIVSYLNSYARHFRVLRKIRFYCDVRDLQQLEDKAGWQLRYYDQRAKEEYEAEFDLVVVCNGLYSTPHLPEFPNQDGFRGRILHTSQFREQELDDSAKVVIVGFGKSALDRAEDVARCDAEVTLTFRSAHWPVPRKFLGLIENKFMISRFVSAFLPLYQQPSSLAKRLHRYGGWLIWVFWRCLEWIVRTQFRLGSAGVLPHSRLERDLFTGDFVASPDIYPLIHSGRIKTHRATIKHFTEEGVVLDNGVVLDADTVVLGTGWAYDRSMLPDEFDDLVDDDGLYLYRHILHPDVPGLVFVGLTSTFNNSLSAHLEARWLVAMLKDELTLPDPEIMRAEIAETKAWKRKIMPMQGSRASLLQLHALHYHDQLLLDMGIDCERKSNFIAELFGAYLPRDYKEIPSIYLRKKSERSKATPEEQAGDVITQAFSLPPDGLEGINLRSEILDGIDLSERSLQGADLRHASLRSANLSSADLAAADISGADLTSAELFNTDFTGAIMSRVDLERAFLIDATLSLAHLNGANLTRAHLSGADLTSARLNNARMVGADLSDAKLIDADLRGANLSHCDLSNADLTGADLTGATLNNATLLAADFSRANVTGIEFNQRETCKDIRIETANGNALFKRYAQDQAYVEEYAVTRPMAYRLWKYSSNCGRSLSLWIWWCVCIAVVFSLVFHFHLGGNESFALSQLAEEPGYDPDSWAPMLYYSVVTFTTLGFGDIVPRTQEAAWWIMGEVVLGYFMLGGLITILATKLARRS
ncbi:MAG: pentapeptide repeat-containing protein [Pseudomonadales bacterium]